MKISTRETTRYLMALLDIYPYFHIYRSIWVKFDAEVFSIFFSFCELRNKQYKEYHTYFILLLLLLLLLLLFIPSARYLHLYTWN
jgi:hypothetical protein